jgi:hypothetical protein
MMMTRMTAALKAQQQRCAAMQLAAHQPACLCACEVCNKDNGRKTVIAGQRSCIEIMLVVKGLKVSNSSGIRCDATCRLSTC